MFKVVLANGDEAYAETPASIELAARTLMREARQGGLSNKALHLLVGSSMYSDDWTTVAVGIGQSHIRAAAERTLRGAPVSNYGREWL